MKYTKKSQVKTFFDVWLTLMEDAYRTLTRKEFRELEDKIRGEIAYHRKRKK